MKTYLLKAHRTVLFTFFTTLFFIVAQIQNVFSQTKNNNQGMAFSLNFFEQYSTPGMRNNPNITIVSSLTVGNSISFNINSNTYFMIVNVTSGRIVRISSCRGFQ